MAAATAANIKLNTRRAGTRAPGICAANLIPALVVAGVGIVRSFVLAVGVRIELGAIAGVVDDFLCRGRCCGHHRQESGCSRAHARFNVQWPSPVLLVRFRPEKFTMK